MRRSAIMLALAACGGGPAHVSIPASASASPPEARGTLEPVPTVEDALAWLSDDTVSVAVARGPFALPRVGGHEDPGLFALPNGGTFDSLVGQTVVAAVTGISRFRAPHGLGEGPYDGCSIVIFASSVHARGGDFTMKQEHDIWTTQVAFPTDRVALICSDEAFMKTVIGRLHAHARARTFMTSVAWSHVDTSAKAWGLHAGEEIASYAAAPAESVFTYGFYVENLMGHVIFL